MKAQKYADGDCRRWLGGLEPVRRSTSRGRGSGEVIEQKTMRRNAMDRRMAHRFGGRS